MSHHLSLGLGIAFVLLAIAAVLLQAWLWNPKYWDPIAKKSHAPPFWMKVHRGVGYAYAAIYVVMMWHMVPRFWNYAIELPARTVVHVVAAIVIGVILITKIAILRWFRHFEEAMPALGFALLVATVVLGSMSIPIGLRAYTGPQLTPDERARVERILASLDFDPRTDTHALADPAALARGRDVITHQCAQCHDLRSILSEPRTGPAWLTLVRRMAAKPTIGAPIDEHDILHATAYLVAIPPDLQQDSAARYADRQRRAADAVPADIAPRVPLAAPDGGASLDASATPDAGVGVAAGDDAGARPRPRPRRRTDAGAIADAGSALTIEALVPTSGPSVDAAVPTPRPARSYSPELGRSLLSSRCNDCHGDDELTNHGGDDRAGWAGVVRRMVVRGADLSADESRVLTTYLASTRGL